jgi:ATP-binding cassette subfamily B multidrug efflux pump
MIKLLKRMRRQEALMALLCAVLVGVQVYFDLRLPDFMTQLTTLIKTPGSATADILSVGAQMLGCTLASAVLAVGCGFLAAKTASGFSFTVREQLFHHVMDVGSEEMQDFSVPSLITRTTNDITQIQMIVAMGLQMLIKAPIMAVWAVIKILGKSWELSAVTAGCVVALCVMVFAIMSTCLPRFRLVQKLTDKINRVARENLTGINVVHAFNAEDYQNRKFDVPSRDMMNLQLKNQRLFALLQPMMGLGMNGLALAVYWVGAALVEAIPLTDAAARLGMFTNVLVFSTYATYVVMSFMMLVMIFMLVPQAQVSAERINEVLDRGASIREGSVREGRSFGTVEFRDVSFRYPHAAADELSHISFRVEHGQTLAIIGATGSGKTTLVSLIPRFYDATQGEVLVDGVNVRDYAFDALYDRLGYVTQKAVLFSGTVRDNVFFGESRAEETGAALQDALSLSQAAEFVDKYPEGAAHPIAQLGRNVSGGQKQRLSIARALARRPEILIFDDSFSALDYRTDAKLRAELTRKLPDATKIIVAQRISTIRHADQILVLDRGAIVGKGTHDELMKNCSVYREIAMSQLSAAELEEGGTQK